MPQVKDTSISRGEINSISCLTQTLGADKSLKDTGESFKYHVIKVLLLLTKMLISATRSVN